MFSLKKLSLMFALALAASALSTGAASAQPAYEPNDSILTGYGPLANNSSYTAALETGNDRDYYFFYVTTMSTAQLTFTLTNLGGGTPYEDDARFSLTDSHGDHIQTLGGYIEAFDYATESVTLKAGKYFVVVENENSYAYGESYRLETSGTDGAFGDYATIAANCAAATAPVTTYQSQLATAEAKLRKAEAKFRQLRYSRKRRVRIKVRNRLKHVKAVVAAEKASLKAAETGQKPWCFIPA
ncbi:MAG TPA: hypothetical protein VNC16_09260 [Solirubrobacterales bacterium]|jgi:hypothetical protein|nr:hypothetical protein [Solirubrobacterales bacterium]